MRIIKTIIITIMKIMIILWWWIIMNKSLPHFLNGGICITKRGLQWSDSLRAGWELSMCACVIGTVRTLETSYSLFTSVSQYKIVSVYVTSQPVYSVFAMLGEHFPGDLAVYISHSNRFFVLNICHFRSRSRFSFSVPLCIPLFSSYLESLGLYKGPILCSF